VIILNIKAEKQGSLNVIRRHNTHCKTILMSLDSCHMSVSTLQHRRSFSNEQTETCPVFNVPLTSDVTVFIESL